MSDFTYDAPLLKDAQARDPRGVLDLAADAHVSRTTLWRILNGRGSLRTNTVVAVARELGVDPRIRLREPAAANTVRADVFRPCVEVMRLAVARAVYRAWDVLLYGYSGPPVRTARGKITSTSPEDDPTEVLDAVTSEAIGDTLREATLPGRPLEGGFHLLDEELGYVGEFCGEGGVSDLILWVDSTDDTSQARRALGGTSLIGAYHREHGWVGAVAADMVRWRLYHRVLGEGAQAVRLRRPPARGPLGCSPKLDEVPVLDALPLRTSGRRGLEGASLNLYLGKPQRLLDSAEQGADLLRGGVRELFSHGGSRGPILVADGTIDLAAEFVKGFRPLDCAPGTFIAAGVPGAAVVDLAGTPLDFGPDAAFEELVDGVVDAPTTVARFDELRRRFVVAASKSLADETVAMLRGADPGTPPQRS